MSIWLERHGSTVSLVGLWLMLTVAVPSLAPFDMWVRVCVTGFGAGACLLVQRMIRLSRAASSGRVL